MPRIWGLFLIRNESTQGLSFIRFRASCPFLLLVLFCSHWFPPPISNSKQKMFQSSEWTEAESPTTIRRVRRKGATAGRHWYAALSHRHLHLGYLFERDVCLNSKRFSWFLECPPHGTNGRTGLDGG